MTAKTSTQKLGNKVLLVAKTRLEAMTAFVLVDSHIIVHLECVPVSVDQITFTSIIVYVYTCRLLPFYY